MAYAGQDNITDSTDPMQAELLRRAQGAQTGQAQASGNGAAFTPGPAPSFVPAAGTGPTPTTVTPPSTINPLPAASTSNPFPDPTATASPNTASFTPTAPGATPATPTGVAAPQTPLSQNSVNTSTGTQMVDLPTATTFLTNRAAQLGVTLTPAQMQQISLQYGLTPGTPINQATVNQIAAALPSILKASSGGGATTALPQPSSTNLGPQGVGGSAQANSLFDMLMQRATQGENISPSDAIIQQEVAAYRNANTQAGRSYLRNLAERAGPNANIGAETRQVFEAGGQATGAFEAQLMDQERNARRQEIEQALSGAAGLLTNEQQQALQQELAILNLQQNAYQFDATNSRITQLGY